MRGHLCKILGEVQWRSRFVSKVVVPKIRAEVFFNGIYCIFKQFLN